MTKVPVPEGPAAGIALSPELAAALSTHLMMGPNLAEVGIDAATVTQQLNAEAQAVVAGDLAQVRRILTSQVVTLDRMFHHLFGLACAGGKHSHDLYERYLRLALKAQAQSVRTMHVLGRLCHEPARKASARQAKAEPVESVSAPHEASSALPPTPAPRRVVVPVPSVFLPLPSATTDQSLNGCRGAGGALHGLSAPAAG